MAESRDYSKSWRLALHEKIYEDVESNRHASEGARVRSRPFGNAKVFTVPEYLRHVQPAAYAPLTLVMGPYHRVLESAEMVEYKIFSAKRKRSCFQDLHKYISENISQFRETYDKKLEIESASLSLMLALDSCLLSDILVEYAARNYPFQHCHYDDYVLPRRHFWSILRDLVLMENQIPTQLVFKAMCESGHELPDMVSKVMSYIYPFRATNLRSIKIDLQACHHLLDYLYRICSHKSELDDPRAKGSDVQIPTATQLRAAGIDFTPVIYGDLSSIKFVPATGKLHLPEVKMCRETESWFRNLIAYEQCRNDLSVHWCSYMRLMVCLINTSEDVKLLVQKKVLVDENMGSNEAMANVWNKLGVNVELLLTEGDKTTMNSINSYCGSITNTWRSTVRYLYFSRRWSFILAFVVSLVLFMMILQTTFIIAQYETRGHNHPSP